MMQRNIVAFDVGDENRKKVVWSTKNCGIFQIHFQ